MATLARIGGGPARTGRGAWSGGTWPSAAVGLGLGLLALGPGLGRGFLLSYDMVFVPRLPFAAAWPGLAPPRAVPSDLVIAAMSRALPGDIVQKVVLLAVFVLACAGAGGARPRSGVAAGRGPAWPVPAARRRRRVRRDGDHGAGRGARRAAVPQRAPGGGGAGRPGRGPAALVHPGPAAPGVRRPRGRGRVRGAGGHAVRHAGQPADAGRRVERGA